MTDGMYGCNPERSHAGPCGADDCWWSQLIDELDQREPSPGVPARVNPEQAEIQGVFASLLAMATGEGGDKRAAGVKPFWKIDPGHRAASNRHRARHEAGERYDADTGIHHRVKDAWRSLAIAYQEMAEDGLIPEDPT